MLGRVVADRYELDAVIGRRPAGVAYRAVDRAWRVGDPGRRLVSLTMLDADRGAEPGLAARIDRVAAEVRSLAHPVFDVPSDVVRDGHRLIVVSEHRAGRTLHSLLGGGLGMGWPLRNVLPIGHRIADGLTEAHRAGLAHGGLCLETVLLSADEAVHVLDSVWARRCPRSLRRRPATFSRSLGSSTRCWPGGRSAPKHRRSGRRG